jgi:DMSO/TMAO reductase YedYZ heme-binding membrane subunit
VSGLALAAAGPSAYWYLARGTGAVSLVLLTVSVALGVTDWSRVTFGQRWPRFAIDSLHRDVSLLVIALLAIHIVTSVLDSFAPIGLIDAVIPLVSKYRPLWMGFGALSFDLLLALAATSLMRRRLGYRTWRAIHWLAYAAWPVAVLHGLGTGSDTKTWWMLALTAACVAVVLGAVAVRIGWSERRAWRIPAAALAIATPVGLIAFTAAGPLQTGWARRAGTPANLLPKKFVPVAVRRSAPAVPQGDTLKAPFSGRLDGTVTQAAAPGGAVVDLRLRVTGGARGNLRVRMAGAPVSGGGLTMTGSQVDLSAIGLKSVFEGRILSLQGDQFLARLHNASGAVVDLQANLNIDNQTGSVTGTMSARPVGGTP